MAAGRRSGFTLIEVLAAIFLTAVVVTGATAFFFQLQDAANAATARTAEGRHAVAVLDRLARDLEGAFLLTKPESVDPLEHPWLFLAEERYSSEGADRLKFVVRNHVPRHHAGHAADLAMVSWLLRPSDEGGYELLRGTRSGLPPGLDREFPPEDEMALVAEGIAVFGVRLLDAEGEWQSAWDSSTIVESSELPLAAELSLALLDRDVLEIDGFEEPGETFQRRVLVPVRPLDLASLIEAPSEAEDDDELLGDDEDEEIDGDGIFGGGGTTIAQCVQANREDLVAVFDANLVDAFFGLDPDTPAAQTQIAEYCP